jgi:hypothetical protein
LGQIHMKTSIKFATGLILAAAALVASGSAAQAGEGGAAGSVSIKFTGGKAGVGLPGDTDFVAAVTPDVARLSTSVAVGKSYAVATAFTSGDNTLTSAVGAGGSFTLTAANTNTAAFTADVSNDKLDDKQENSFAGSGATTLKPDTGVTLAE